jgi:hypothetical protein
MIISFRGAGEAVPIDEEILSGHPSSRNAGPEVIWPLP